MRREGDRIIFDSDEQQENFERDILKKYGASFLMDQLLEALGRATMDTQTHWDAIEKAGLYDPETEEAVYHWTTRELRVRHCNSPATP